MDGEQLDKTLKAQSEQLDRTFAEQRTRTLDERFDTVAEHLGSDKPPAVRLAGVYAMAGLADAWPEHRQMRVEVLCGYLRMPYEPEPGLDAPAEKRLAFQASREVRRTVIRVIAAHLNGTAPVSWCGLNFDFAGAVFDGGDFSGAKFSGGTANFTGAEFSGGRSASAAPSSPAGRSASAARGSPAGRSTSAGSRAGRSPRTLAQGSICPIHRPVSCCRQPRALHPIALYREKELVNRRIQA